MKTNNLILVKFLVLVICHVSTIVIRLRFHSIPLNNDVCVVGANDFIDEMLTIMFQEILQISEFTKFNNDHKLTG